MDNWGKISRQREEPCGRVRPAQQQNRMEIRVAGKKGGGWRWAARSEI